MEYLRNFNILSSSVLLWKRRWFTSTSRIKDGLFWHSVRNISFSVYFLFILLHFSGKNLYIPSATQWITSHLEVRKGVKDCKILRKIGWEWDGRRKCDLFTRDQTFHPFISASSFDKNILYYQRHSWFRLKIFILPAILFIKTSIAAQRRQKVFTVSRRYVHSRPK